MCQALQLANERLVHEPPVNARKILREAWHFFQSAAIEAPRRLADVAVQMFRADPMVNAVRLPFEQHPNAFHTIHMREVVADIFACAVIDRARGFGWMTGKGLPVRPVASYCLVIASKSPRIASSSVPKPAQSPDVKRSIARL